MAPPRPSTSRVSTRDAAGPIVSVIIATHDYARYLPEALASVHAQTFTEWECVVLDDGSTDATPSVLRTWEASDPRFRSARESHRGVAAARNQALTMSRGRFIQFLDADDLLSAAKLERDVAAFGQNAVDIVYGPARYFDDGDPHRELRDWWRSDRVDGFRPISGSGSDALGRLIEANVMTTAAPLVRKSVLDEVGAFDERLKRLEDWDLWFRCAVAGKRFLFVPAEEPVALIRVHSGSLSSVPAETLLADDIEMRERWSRSLGPPDRARNERLLMDARTAIAEIGIQVALAGEPGRGLRLLLPRAISDRRRRWLAWSVALLVMQLPGGRRLVDKLRSRGRRTHASP